MTISFLHYETRTRIGVALLYLILAVVLTLPLVFNLRTAAPDPVPSRIGAWVMGWGAHQLAEDPLGYFDSNAFYPLDRSLSYFDHSLGIVLPMLPVILFTDSPLLAYNLFAILSFAIAAFGTYLLASEITANFKAAFVAGLIFAFAPIRLAYLSNANLLALMWLPFMLFYLNRYFRGGSGRNLILSALFYVLMGLSGWLLLVYAAVALVIHAILDLLLYRGEVSGNIPLFILVYLVATALFLPLLIPYLDTAQDVGLSNRIGGMEIQSADVQDYLFGNVFHPMHGRKVRSFLMEDSGMESTRSYIPVFPGYSVLILALVALAPFGFHRLSVFRRREFMFFTLLALVGLLLTLGPELLLFGNPTGIPLPFAFLNRFLPPLPGLGITYRFHLLTMLGLALLSAFGFNKLVRSERGDPAPKKAIDLVATALISGIVLFEYLSIPVPISHLPTPEDFPEVYHTLAQQPDHGVVYEAPYPHPRDSGFPLRNRLAGLNSNALYYSTLHWHPTVNGHCGLYPPLYLEAESILRDLPDQAAVDLLQSLNCTYLLLHCRDSETVSDAERGFLALDAFEKVSSSGSDLLLRVARRDARSREPKLDLSGTPIWISRFGGGRLLIPLVTSRELPVVFTRPEEVPIRLHWWRGEALVKIERTQLRLPLIVTAKVPTTAQLKVTPPEDANRVGILIESHLFRDEQVQADTSM